MGGKNFIILLIIILLSNIQSFSFTIPDETDSSNNFRRINFGFSYSPRYTNVIFGDFYIRDFKPEYVSGTILSNYNLNLFYNLRKNNLSFNIGFSLLQYGDKQSHVIAFVANLGNGIEDYDTISIIEKYRYLAIQFGLNKIFYSNKFIYEGEIGLINNFYNSAVEVAIEPQYEDFTGYGPIRAKDYFVSAYIKFGVDIKMGNVLFFILPIFNYTFYNIYRYEDPGYVKLYQIGADFGMRFHL